MIRVRLIASIAERRRAVRSFARLINLSMLSAGGVKKKRNSIAESDERV